MQSKYYDGDGDPNSGLSPVESAVAVTVTVGGVVEAWSKLEGPSFGSELGPKRHLLLLGRQK